MENEQNQPQPPQAQPPAGNPANPNPNPGKRGRRRRRRRGGGGGAQQQAQSNGQQQAQGGQPQQQAQGAGQQHRKHKQHGGGGHKQGGHRQQRHANPGNQQGGRGGGQRRRRRGPGGQPAFVGPMDHSYRQGNGFEDDFQPGYQPNFNGNFHGGHGRGRQNHLGLPQDNVEVVPIKVENITTVEGAPKVVCFIEDLFFHAKIREVAKKIGVNVEFAKADKETIDRITEDEEKPPLIIFDLNNLNAKPLVTIPKLKSKLKRQTSIVGFVSHIQGDLKLKAQEAGCDMVVPRSAFSANLPNLLRRYAGMEEEAGYERGPSH